MGQNSETQKDQNALMKNSRKWLLIGSTIIIVFTLVIAGVLKLSHKVDDMMQHNLADLQNKEHHDDSVRTARNDSLYSLITGIKNPDSFYVNVMHGAGALHLETKGMRDYFARSCAEFKSSLPDSGESTMLDTALSRKYFIESGLAQQMKKDLEDYEGGCMSRIPDTSGLDSVSVFSRTLSMQATMPANTKLKGTWENLNFNQAPVDVLINFKYIDRDIQLFEDALLAKYSMIPVTTLPDDSTGH